MRLSFNPCSPYIPLFDHICVWKLRGTWILHVIRIIKELVPYESRSPVIRDTPRSATIPYGSNIEWINKSSWDNSNIAGFLYAGAYVVWSGLLISETFDINVRQFFFRQ